MGGEKGEWNTSASLSLVPASPYVRTSLIENWVPWRSSRDIFLIPPPLLTSSPAFCCWGKTAAVQCGPWAAEGPINRVSDWHVHTWTPLWRQGTWQLLKRCPSGGELCQKELIKKKKEAIDEIWERQSLMIPFLCHVFLLSDSFYRMGD